MTAPEIQALHTSLLLMLNAVGEIGIQETSILPRIRLDFRDLTAPQLSVELRAMADRGWIVSYQPSLGGQRWKITGLGRAALQEAGLA